MSTRSHSILKRNNKMYVQLNTKRLMKRLCIKAETQSYVSTHDEILLCRKIKTMPAPTHSQFQRDLAKYLIRIF